MQTTEQDEPSQPETAEAPFNKPAADTILRSSDRIDYHVRRSILAEASPFFEDMFSLPQLSRKRKHQEADDEYVNGKPVIVVTESSQTLRALLLFCYPCRDPALEDAAEICDVLEAARKYDAQDVVDRVREQFAAAAETQSYALYALAYKRGWRDEMQVAATASLASPVPTAYPEIIETLPTGTFLRLQRYRQACSAAAREVLRPLIPDNEVFQPSMMWITRVDFEDRCFFGCEYECWKPDPATLCRFAPLADSPLDSSPLPAWIQDFAATLRREVCEVPRGSSVTRPELVVGAASRAKHCLACAAMAYSGAEGFAALLAERIEEVVGEIKLAFIEDA